MPFHLVFLLLSNLIESAHAVPVRLHGLNYNSRQGPDWDWNKCKSRPQIQTDLSLLKQLTNRIRILSLKDCDQGVLVTSVAREFGMQLWLGMWVGLESWVFEEEKGTLQYMIDQGMFADDTILGISVGSEAIYREDATADEVIRSMNEGTCGERCVSLHAANDTDDVFKVYEMLQQAGITNIPVTIVDIAPIYSSNGALRRAVNVTMTNTFPFWEGIPIEGAVDDLQLDLDWLLNLPESRNKPFVLGETGWPSDGFIAGVGIAGPDLQRRYFEEAYCRMHVENQWAYYWFTGIDNAWRQEQDPENTIEGNFGFFYANLSLKDHFRDLSFQCSDGVTYSFAELDLTIPTGFTPAPAILDPASCQAHTQCAELYGNCCPNDFGTILGCCDGTAVPPPPPRLTPMPLSPPTPFPMTSTPVVPPSSQSPVRMATAGPTMVPIVSPTNMPLGMAETEMPVVVSTITSTPTNSRTTTAPSSKPTMPSLEATVTVEPTIAATLTPTTALTVVPSFENSSASPDRSMSSQPVVGDAILPTTPPNTMPAPSSALVGSTPSATSRPIDSTFPPTRIPSVSIRTDSGAGPFFLFPISLVLPVICSWLAL